MLINFESKWKHANTFQKFNENNEKILFQFLEHVQKKFYGKQKLLNYK